MNNTKTCSICLESKDSFLFKKNRLQCNPCLNKRALINTNKRKFLWPVASCKMCNADFHARPWKRKDGYNGGVFCSNKCRSDFELTTRVYKKCEVCDKDFWHWPAHEQKYCSHRCYSKSLENQVAAVCHCCAAPLMITQSGISRNKIGIFFCSRDCYRKTYKGQLHQNYIHGKSYKPRGDKWKTIRLSILERDAFTCQSCFTHKVNLSKKQWRLEVHHKVPFGFFNNQEESNSPKNLVTLCHECHWQEERKGSTIRKQVKDALLNP